MRFRASVLFRTASVLKRINVRYVSQIANSEFAFCGVFFFITAGHNQDRKGAESMNIQKIGKLIAACRKEKGMTQAQLVKNWE